jgi:putative colanic acid biosynthesis acetyltransferase WcaF
MNVLKARDYKSGMSGPCFTLSNRLLRATWNVMWILLAAWTPPPMHAWRRMVLRLFGAKVASTARVYGSARIWNPRNLEMAEFSCIGPRVNCYSMAKISFGPYALASQGAHLCAGTHDIYDPNFQLVVKPIVLSAKAWVAAEAFVGPGVTVGEGAVLGARAVTFSDLKPWTIYTGNPARELKTRTLRSSD